MDVEFPRELQQRVEQAIVEGELARGQVRSLDDLAGRFQSTAADLGRVLRAARRKGLADTVDADSFQILGLPATELASVFTHTAGSGLKPRSEVRQVEVEPASALVAARLLLEAGSPVYRYVRTRWVNDEALANQTNYMPYEVCPGLEQDDVRRHSFQRLLEQKYHAVPVEMEEEYRLLPASGSDREILNLAAGAAVLVVDRVALGATGWPLVWAEIRIRPDRFDYVAALWPQAAKLLR